MTDEIDLKKLWGNQKTDAPDLAELFQRVDKFKKKRLRTLIKLNICLLATALFIGFVWYWYQPEMITTKIGICLVFLAILIFLVAYNKLYPLFAKPGFELNSKHYLQQLLHIKAKELYLQKTMLKLYFALLLLGICLYLVEYTSRMELLWAVVTYAVVLLWIGFNWFYLKPKISKKQNTHLNNLIGKFKKIEDQF